MGRLRRRQGFCVGCFVATESQSGDADHAGAGNCSLANEPKEKAKKGGIHHLVMQCNSSRGSQIRKKTLGRVQIRLLVLFYLMYPPT